jgi:hypothetical protein
MSKGRAVKDLASLPSLFDASTPEQPFAQQLAVAEAKGEEPEDIEEAIISLLQNFRGWTVGDVQRCLAKHPDVYLVPSIIRKLANDGQLEIDQNLSGHASLYTLRRVSPNRVYTTTQNKWVQREVLTVSKPDPKAVIRFEDGMDVGIWKAMSDYKPRIVKELRAILSEYKFDAKLVDRRIDTLIRTNRWFERLSIPGGVAYRLRKDFPMPKPENFQPVDKVLLVPETVVQETLNPEPEPKVEAARVDYSGTMAEDDHLNTLIWKAMSDGKPYKSEDVIALVQAVRPAQSVKTIQNRVSLLGTQGWFDITKAGWSNTWTLKPEIKNPDLKIDTLTKARVQKMQAAFAITTTEKEEVQMTQSTLVKVKAAEPVSAAPLIDLSIRIKGQPFTFAECTTLVQELRQLGYGGVNPKSTTLVQQAVTIKDLDFIGSELDTLVNELAREGFGSNVVMAKRG